MKERYLDPVLSPEERANDLLDRMSLDEKMGQINCLFPGLTLQDRDRAACKHGIGQVSTLFMREMTSLEQAAAWQREIQQTVMAQSEHHIPATFHMEGLCGAYLQGAASFPSGIGRGSTFDPELEEKIGAVVARQELACGITQVLAPVLDISRDSRLGRQGETYGEDPTLAAAMGTAYVQGVQGQCVAGRKAENEAKHFLGFHASMAGIHGTNVEMGERQLAEVYAKPFQAAITRAKLRGVMPCYCSVNGIPISTSRHFLTDWLRGQMGFDGVVGADYSAIANVYSAQHVGEDVTEAGMMALEAGLDIEQQNCVGYNETMKQRFASGEADIEVLNTAVRRVLTAKFRMGLFEHPFALTGTELVAAFQPDSDAETMLRAAKESIVLLKNDGVLPLRCCRKIAVVGAQAKDARIFFGGYTHLSMEEAVHAAANSLAGISAQGNAKKAQYKTVPGTQIQWDETEEFDGILRQQKPHCSNLLEQLCHDLPDTEIAYAYGYTIAGDDTSHFAAALEACQGADVILLMLGGKHGSGSIASMGEGVDSTDINLPACQDAFIQQAAALGIPLVGIHFNGRPISSDIADKYLNAIVEAWNPAEMAAPAISAVLRGECDPSGRLPVTVARNAGQIPIFYNHDFGSCWHQGESIGFPDYVDCTHRPRYEFGFGLSYTTFAFGNLQLDKKQGRTGDTLQITFTVQNTGSRVGTAVPQLYVRDPYASVIRPVKELAGFGRVELQPGQTRTVRFTLPLTQLAFLDRDMRWRVEKGQIDVMVGASSEDIRLEEPFTITATDYVDGKTRGFYAAFSAEE